VAFAIEAEGDAKLPLFLDEALAVASPDRFRGVVQAVLELVRDGRQVIYLAADPQDVAHWQAICTELGHTQPHVIDLADVRALATAALPGNLKVAPRPSVPSPEGHTAVEYAAILRVASFDAFAPIERAHLFHALRDNLPLLFRLLNTIGVNSIGSCDNLLGLEAPDRNSGWLTADEKARVAARIACTRAWHEAFRIGRGTRVDRDALIASGHVSSSYLDRLTAVAQDFDGDARRLIDALSNAASDPRTKGFRADKRLELESFLSERGYLDPRSPLDPAELRIRTLNAARPWIERGAITEAQVLDLIHVLTHSASSSDSGTRGNQR